MRELSYRKVIEVVASAAGLLGNVRKEDLRVAEARVELLKKKAEQNKNLGEAKRLNMILGCIQGAEQIRASIHNYKKDIDADKPKIIIP